MEKTLNTTIEYWFKNELAEMGRNHPVFNSYFRRRTSSGLNEVIRLSKKLELINVYCGANKVVIVFDYGFGKDWVVKIPKCISPNFQRINKVETACDREVEFYKRAKHQGLGEMFAECERFFFNLEDMDIPFYLMRRADIDPEEVERLSESGEWYEGIDEDVICSFNSFYGFNTGFEEFCAEWDISDLHDENVGFIDGKLVCVDYSGYSTEEENMEHFYEN